MTVSESIRRAFTNYANFDGRATVPEYWWFALANVVGQLVLTFLAGALASVFLNLVLIVFLLVMFIPSITVGVRRLHDTDRTGWWFLLSFVPFGIFVLIFFLAQRGTDGPNRFGPAAHQGALLESSSNETKLEL